MSRYDGEWAPYVPVAKRRRRAERAVAKLRRTGPPAEPVTIAGRVIAMTFWGRAWCDNIESYRDYESRLPRGRSYVRNGSVVDLQITSGQITAFVSGTELYRVSITIKETAKPQWRAICADCTGGIDSLVELLQGRLSKSVMERLCRQQSGLFPQPADIRFSCSCPDHASMCKHVAAVLYGVGARLDHKPELLFRLRAVDENDLVARIETALPMSKKGPDKLLQADDMSALFGLDMAEVPKTGRLSDESRGSKAHGTLAGAPMKDGAAATSRRVSSGSESLTKQVPIVRRISAKPSAPKRAATQGRKAPVKAASNKAEISQDILTNSAFSKKAMIARASAKTVGSERKAVGKRRQPKSVVKRMKATGHLVR
jgi:uncharacterized Zn finger protein